MSDLFLRRAQVLVAGVAIDYPPMSIEFRVDFDDDPEPNMAEVILYNLTADTINRIKKGSPIILNTGYKGNTGTIFVGTVESAVTTKDGPDRLTRIKAGDASDRWLKITVSKTFKAGTKASQVIRDIAGGFGLEVGEIKLVEDVTYTNGKVCHGQLQEVLRQVVADTKSKLHISKGVLLIRPPQAGTRTGFLLNSDTGLLGSPGLIEDDKADFTVKCLLNHRLTADSLLQIKSRAVNGNFRVVKGHHIGNDREWHTEMEVKAI